MIIDVAAFVLFFQYFSMLHCPAMLPLWRNGGERRKRGGKEPFSTTLENRSEVLIKLYLPGGVYTDTHTKYDQEY